jgi:probable F420-dependent oxidoreductase
MKVRIAIGLGGSGVDLDELATVVDTMARLRFDSLWVSEVLTSAGPDPVVTLATAAQLNASIKLGTTMLLPGRNELRLAKSLATLDVMTGGRLLLTFVPGLARGPEREAIGVPVAERADAMERALPRLRRWWAGEEVDGVALSPLPVQAPLEFWLGGLAPASLERCGRLADGWLGGACSAAEAAEATGAIARAARAAGREIDPEHFGVSIGYRHEPLTDEQLAGLRRTVRNRDVDPASLVPVGPRQLRRMLEDMIAAGISKFVLRPPAVAASDSRSQAWVDELTALADAVGDLQT